MYMKRKFIYKENRHYNAVFKCDAKEFLCVNFNVMFSEDLIMLNTCIKYSTKL